MPVIQLKTNCNLEKENKKKIMFDTAKVVSEILEKPLENVMVMLDNEEFVMGNSTDTAAFADIKFIKSIEKEKRKKVCDKILDIFVKYLNVEPKRVYMFINEVSVESAWKYTGNEGK